MENLFNLTPITTSDLSIILGIGGLIWAMSSWKTKIENLLHQVVDIGKEIKTNMTDEFREIRGLISSHMPSSAPKSINSASPLSLSPIGEEIDECIDASIWAKELINDVENAFVSDQSGNTAYDAQQFCLDYMRNNNNVSDELLKLMKDCAYSTGNTLYDVQAVIAIKLRDLLLEALEIEEPVI